MYYILRQETGVYLHLHSTHTENTFNVGIENSRTSDCGFCLMGGMTRMSPYSSLSLGAGGTLAGATSSFSLEFAELKGRPRLGSKGGSPPSLTLAEATLELSLRDCLDVALLRVSL